MNDCRLKHNCLLKIIAGFKDVFRFQYLSLHIFVGVLFIVMTEVERIWFGKFIVSVEELR